jgi:hypothetical protein
MLVVLYAVTIFLSAFLLFQVQPLIGKYILPWFGGTAATWTTCLLFFQVLLLAGYTYAHVLSRRSLRIRRWAHIGLLAASLICLPIAPNAGLWKPAPDDAPAFLILLMLAATIGMPYLMLSATGPLLQRWFSRSFPGRSPYRLYALSNVGSLLALLTYPIVVEPMLSREWQVLTWSVAYAVFALLSGWCALRGTGSTAAGADSATLPNPTRAVPAGSVPSTPQPSRRHVIGWLALSASGSVMLLAATNQLCQELTVVPFLWVLPLSLYLLTFIICFDHQRWYDRRVFGPLLAIAIMAACYALHAGADLNLVPQIVIYSGVIFACCMTCHGELVRSKPDPTHLTFFYLIVALGGAIGGAFVALVAPLIFDGYFEFHVALVMCCGATLAHWSFNDRRISPRRHFVLGAASVSLVWLIFWLCANAREYGEGTLVTKRSFYGVLRVTARKSERSGDTIRLYNGQTSHGAQFWKTSKRRIPTTYFAEQSGVGRVLKDHPLRGRMRVGIVGLGVGTLAAYGAPGDIYRFYEINPDVEYLSRVFFSYRKNSEADCQVVLGDARLRMEEEVMRGETGLYDVLVIDAFNGDAIPVHLLTRESMTVYWALLKPSGVLLLHISNRYIELEPVVRTLAKATGCQVVKVTNETDSSIQMKSATWMILARDREILKSMNIQEAAEHGHEDARNVCWTDDFASLWPVIEFD